MQQPHLRSVYIVDERKQSARGITQITSNPRYYQHRTTENHSRTRCRRRNLRQPAETCHPAERSTLQNLTFCAGQGKGRPEIGHPIRRAGMDAETGTAPQIDESAPVSAFYRPRDKLHLQQRKSP